METKRVNLSVRPLNLGRSGRRLPVPREDERQALPPYIPLKTFLGFIQKLKDTVIPERVDGTLLRSYSGSVGRQLVAALKFVSLIDGNNYATENLKKAVKA